jgi:SAM-dependent methyltransferase
MLEPHASEFQALVRLGAGARDMHGIREIGFARRTAASDAFVAREMGRVAVHARSSCRMLEAMVGAVPRVLDVGCSTGAGTVALALSPGLAAQVVVGVDPDALSLRAAEVRARGYGLLPPRVTFRRNGPGAPLPFESDTFDLVVSISVLEFLPSELDRAHLADEMKRVARPGGAIFLSTPTPFRLRDAHSRRWFGDVRRREGYPWASPPWIVRGLFSDCEPLPIEPWLLSRFMARAHLPSSCAHLPSVLAAAIRWAHPWQKLLVRKPFSGLQPQRMAAALGGPIRS